MICVQICSRGEWKATKEILKVQRNQVSEYPLGEYIKHNIHDKECIFYHSGATKTRSSAACQFAIDHWNPQCIFVLGTCGGVSKDLKRLDVVIANKTVQYDCVDKMGNVEELFYEPMTTEIDNSWIDYARLSEPIYQGVIATADHDISFENINTLRESNILVADWESGAIAKICSFNKVRCCVLRGVSDIPEKDDLEDIQNQKTDYESNTPKIMNKLLKSILPSLVLGIGE